jgi:hypothetical protein
MYNPHQLDLGRIRQRELIAESERTRTVRTLRTSGRLRRRPPGAVS